VQASEAHGYDGGNDYWPLVNGRCMQLLDPVTGAPNAARGVHGKPITAYPADASAITPDDLTVYDPPITVSVWDATAQAVTVVPYGKNGDASVLYPTKPGMKIPVLVKKVMATGTTATVLRGQRVYIPGVLTAGRMTIESGAVFITESNDPIILESGS